MRTYLLQAGSLLALAVTACSGSDSRSGNSGAGGLATAGAPGNSVGGQTVAVGGSNAISKGGSTTGAGGSVSATGGTSSVVGLGGAATSIGGTPTTTTSVATVGGASPGVGGSTAKGGGTGGSTAKGGASSSGGTSAKAGATSTGGVTSTGGASSVGGATGTAGPPSQWPQCWGTDTVPTTALKQRAPASDYKTQVTVGGVAMLLGTNRQACLTDTLVNFDVKDLNDEITDVVEKVKFYGFLDWKRGYYMNWVILNSGIPGATISGQGGHQGDRYGHMNFESSEECPCNWGTGDDSNRGNALPRLLRYQSE